MICHHCACTNEQNAIFCSYCGQQLRQENESPAEPQVVPALGSTIDLRRFQQPAPGPPASPRPIPIPAPPQRLTPAPNLTTRSGHKRHKRHKGWQWDVIIAVVLVSVAAGPGLGLFIFTVLGALTVASHSGGISSLLRGLTWLMSMTVVVLGGMVLLGVFKSLGGGILPAIALIWIGTKLVK